MTSNSSYVKHRCIAIKFILMQVRKAALELSTEMNAKRKNRGLKPRPVRAVMVGFPNVGKSALINRLLNRRVCESAPKPGVTRDLKWLRIGAELDLLDAPGGDLSYPSLADSLSECRGRVLALEVLTYCLAAACLVPLLVGS